MADRGSANRVSAWFVTLPLGEKSPLRRFEKIREQTRQRKASGAASAIDAFLRFADASGSTPLTALGVRLVSSLRPYHMIVTNVHGPMVPLYLLGGRMREFHPLVPLFANQGLSVAMMSYDGRVHVGLNADWDAVRDLGALADCFEASLLELREAAERRPAARPRRLAGRRPAQDQPLLVLEAIHAGEIGVHRRVIVELEGVGRPAAAQAIEARDQAPREARATIARELDRVAAVSARAHHEIAHRQVRNVPRDLHAVAEVGDLARASDLSTIRSSTEMSREPTLVPFTFPCRCCVPCT